MNPSYFHVVFDLDGTRIDLSPSILASLQACHSAGLQPMRPFTQDLIAPLPNATLTSLHPEGQDDCVDRLAALIKSHDDASSYRETRGCAGITAMKELRHPVYRMLIATNKDIQPARRIVEHLEWCQHIRRSAQARFLRASAARQIGFAPRLGWRPIPKHRRRLESQAPLPARGMGCAPADYLVQ